MSGFGKPHEWAGGPARSVASMLVERNANLKQLLDVPAVLIFAIAIESDQWVEGYTRATRYQPVKIMETAT
jgi:hypothetical protein